jgi:hypothetical protein
MKQRLFRQQQGHSRTSFFTAFGLEIGQTQSQTTHRNFSRFDAGVQLGAFAIDQETHGGIALPNAVRSLGASRVVHDANERHAQLRRSVPRHHHAAATEGECSPEVNLERRGWSSQSERSEQTENENAKFHMCSVIEINVCITWVNSLSLRQNSRHVGDSHVKIAQPVQHRMASNADVGGTGGSPLRSAGRPSRRNKPQMKSNIITNWSVL